MRALNKCMHSSVIPFAISCVGSGACMGVYDLNFELHALFTSISPLAIVGIMIDSYSHCMLWDIIAGFLECYF